MIAISRWSFLESWGFTFKEFLGVENFLLTVQISEISWTFLKFWTLLVRCDMRARHGHLVTWLGVTKMFRGNQFPGQIFRNTVFRLYESPGRKPGWRFTARFKSQPGHPKHVASSGFIPLHFRKRIGSQFLIPWSVGLLCNQRIWFQLEKVIGERTSALESQKLKKIRSFRIFLKLLWEWSPSLADHF